MKKHIDKLRKFIAEKDISKELNRLSVNDAEIKSLWIDAQSNRELQKIKSAEYVEFLISCFENSVISSPIDIKLRNVCKYEMFIAQYKALRGLKVWCDKIDTISICKDSNFPDLTEADVDVLISRMDEIISKIDN